MKKFFFERCPYPDHEDSGIAFVPREESIRRLGSRAWLPKAD